MKIMQKCLEYNLDKINLKCITEIILLEKIFKNGNIHSMEVMDGKIKLNGQLLLISCV